MSRTPARVAQEKLRSCLPGVKLSDLAAFAQLDLTIHALLIGEAAARRTPQGKAKEAG
jgi:hypothetical protein